MEHAILKFPSEMYHVGEWAIREEVSKPHLANIAREFERLRKLLSRVRLVVRCSQYKCERRARFMNLERTDDGGWSPLPSFWCKEHGPEPDFLPLRLKIGFNALRVFKRKGDRKRLAKQIREALGIRKGTRITEEFSRLFFQRDSLEGDHCRVHRYHLNVVAACEMVTRALAFHRGL